jgi:hypothetical protein
MSFSTSPVGLRQSIAAAQSVKDVSDLLTVGSQFTAALPRTVRSWEATAKRRIAKLDAPVWPASEGRFCFRISSTSTGFPRVFRAR